MEQWERDAIERRIERVEEAGRQRVERVEEAGRETQERLRKFEWRDGMRFHLNVTVAFWILMAALVMLEIVVAATKG